MVVKRPLAVGDSVKCGGERVTIGKILFQDAYHANLRPGEKGISDYYDIEFEDSKGNYRHWKSNVDGGIVVLSSHYINTEKYLSAFTTTTEYLVNVKNLTSVLVISKEDGTFKVIFEYKNGSLQSAVVSSGFEVKTVETITPDLAMFIKCFSQDIASLVSINPNIGSIKFKLSEGLRYFTKVEEIKMQGQEDKILIV